MAMESVDDCATLQFQHGCIIDDASVSVCSNVHDLLIVGNAGGLLFFTASRLLAEVCREQSFDIKLADALFSLELNLKPTVLYLSDHEDLLLATAGPTLCFISLKSTEAAVLSHTETTFTVEECIFISQNEVLCRGDGSLVLLNIEKEQVNIDVGGNVSGIYVSPCENVPASWLDTAASRRALVVCNAGTDKLIKSFGAGSLDVATISVELSRMEPESLNIWEKGKITGGICVKYEQAVKSLWVWTVVAEIDGMLDSIVVVMELDECSNTLHVICEAMNEMYYDGQLLTTRFYHIPEWKLVSIVGGCVTQVCFVSWNEELNEGSKWAVIHMREGRMLETVSAKDFPTSLNVCRTFNQSIRRDMSTDDTPLLDSPSVWLLTQGNGKVLLNFADTDSDVLKPLLAKKVIFERLPCNPLVTEGDRKAEQEEEEREPSGVPGLSEDSLSSEEVRIETPQKASRQRKKSQRRTPKRTQSRKKDCVSSLSLLVSPLGNSSLTGENYYHHHHPQCENLMKLASSLNKHKSMREVCDVVLKVLGNIELKISSFEIGVTSLVEGALRLCEEDKTEPQRICLPVELPNVFSDDVCRLVDQQREFRKYTIALDTFTACLKCKKTNLVKAGENSMIKCDEMSSDDFYEDLKDNIESVLIKQCDHMLDLFPRCHNNQSNSYNVRDIEHYLRTLKSVVHACHVLEVRSKILTKPVGKLPAREEGTLSLKRFDHEVSTVEARRNLSLMSEDAAVITKNTNDENNGDEPRKPYIGIANVSILDLESGSEKHSDFYSLHSESDDECFIEPRLVGGQESLRREDTVEITNFFGKTGPTMTNQKIDEEDENFFWDAIGKEARQLDILSEILDRVESRLDIHDMVGLHKGEKNEAEKEEKILWPLQYHLDIEKDLALVVNESLEFMYRDRRVDELKANVQRRLDAEKEACEIIELLSLSSRSQYTSKALQVGKRSENPWEEVFTKLLRQDSNYDDKTYKLIMKMKNDASARRESAMFKSPSMYLGTSHKPVYSSPDYITSSSSKSCWSDDESFDAESQSQSADDVSQTPPVDRTSYKPPKNSSADSSFLKSTPSAADSPTSIIKPVSPSFSDDSPHKAEPFFAQLQTDKTLNMNSSDASGTAPLDLPGENQTGAEKTSVSCITETLTNKLVNEKNDKEYCILPEEDAKTKENEEIAEIKQEKETDEGGDGERKEIQDLSIGESDHHSKKIEASELTVTSFSGEKVENSEIEKNKLREFNSQEVSSEEASSPICRSEGTNPDGTNLSVPPSHNELPKNEDISNESGMKVETVRQWPNTTDPSHDISFCSSWKEETQVMEEPAGFLTWESSTINAEHRKQTVRDILDKGFRFGEVSNFNLNAGLESSPFLADQMKTEEPSMQPSSPFQPANFNNIQMDKDIVERQSYNFGFSATGSSGFSGTLSAASTGSPSLLTQGVKETPSVFTGFGQSTSGSGFAFFASQANQNTNTGFGNQVLGTSNFSAAPSNCSGMKPRNVDKLD